MYHNGKHSADEKKMERLIKKALTDASEKGKELFAEGFATAKEVIREKSRTFQDKAAELRGKSVEEITEDATEYVRRHPWRSLAAAMGVGVILGMIFRPRKDDEYDQE